MDHRPVAGPYAAVTGEQSGHFRVGTANRPARSTLWTSITSSAGPRWLPGTRRPSTGLYAQVSAGQ